MGEMGIVKNDGSNKFSLFPVKRPGWSQSEVRVRMSEKITLYLLYHEKCSFRCLI